VILAIAASAADANAADPNTTQPDTTQANTAQTNTTQANTAQPNTAQPNTAQTNAATVVPSLYIQPAVNVKETYTSNANFAASQLARSDWITEVLPSLVVHDIASRFRLIADVKLDALYYANGAESNRVLPQGGFDAILEAVKDHLFIDAGAVATQVPTNLLLATPQGGSTFNTFTTYAYHLTPDFKGELPRDLRYDVRSENAWTHSPAGPAEAATTNFAHDSAELARLPEPYGWALRVEQIDSTFRLAATPSTRQQFGRLILRAAVDPQLVLGLRGGVERENFMLDQNARPIWGGEFDWRPTDRTDVSAIGEKRSFGAGYRYSATHHTPWLALSLSGLRDIVTTPQDLAALPATGNVAGLIDTMLSTQYQNPVALAQAEQNLMTNQNLPDALAGSAAFFTPYPYLSEKHQGSAVWTGRRNSAALTIFETSTQPLPADLASTVTPATLQIDHVQRGASINLNHHISPFTALSATGTASRIEGNGAETGTAARQESGTLQVNHELSTKTRAFAGVRYQTFWSNQPVSSGASENVREEAAFVGLNHRF
jgi:uncharacterized protein (PEP-CTERM system associated)